MSAPAAADLRAILLDIEGTTTPIAFVYEVLFPHARAHLREHVERRADAPEYRPLFDLLRREHAADVERGESPPPWIDASRAADPASVVRYCEWLMDRDRKSTALKELQGRIWQEGYRSGALVGQVFDDVPRALRRWHDRGLRAAIFSSGSVLAQQLLFRHSSAGDLARLIAGYFDTTTGAKGESESYRRIASKLAAPSDAVLFVSDVVRELDAARAAGMRTACAMRPGNPPPPAHDHAVVETFDDLPV